MDQRLAGLLFFSLQIAQSNLKFINFEPQSLRDAADPAQGSEVLKLLMDALEEPPDSASPDSPRKFEAESDSGKKPAASGELEEPAKALAT